MESGSLSTLMAPAHLPVPLNTGRGISIETCGLDNVLLPDDLWIGSDTDTNSALVYTLKVIISYPHQGCLYKSLIPSTRSSWWRHQMETVSALLAPCAGNSSVTGEFPAKGPVTWSFEVFFDLRLNKRLSKQSWGWWFETPSFPELFSENARINTRQNIVGHDGQMKQYG